MPTAWDNLLADWATDNALEVSSAVMRLNGTPYWMEARRLFAVGAPPSQVRAALDAALAGSGMKPVDTHY